MPAIVEPKRPVYDPDDWLDWDVWLERHCGVTLGSLRAEDISAGMVDLVAKCLESPMFCMRNFFHTVDKESGLLVRYEPWVGQTLLDYVMEYQRQCELPVRIIEIKPRQVGWTQHNIQRGLHNCLFPNRKTVIMMPDQDVLDENAPRVGAIINNLPPFLSLMRRIENKNQWEFDNPNSRERISDPGLASTFTLTIPTGYRGAPGVNYVCFSEFAHYDAPLEVMHAVMGGIGKSSATSVVIDTTPAGHDTVYEPMVLKAIARNPRWVSQWTRKGGFSRQDVIDGKLGVPDNPKGWVPVFVAWWQHEAYCTKDESPMGQLPKLTPEEIRLMTEGPVGETRIGTVDAYGGDEELWLMREFGLGLPRLAWRRYAIDDVEAADWRYKLLSFRTEFATTYSDCFVDYGLTPFDPLGLDVMRRQCRPPLVRGCLRRERNPQSGQDEICVDTTYRSEHDEVRVWAMPQPGEHYIMAIDPAYAWESEDADWTAVQVLRRRDEKQVAVYHARRPPHDIISQVQLLYEFYNRPLTVVETEEGQGYGYVRLLWDAGVRHQYYWKRPDVGVPESTKYLGWQSDARTKPILYSTIVSAVAALGRWAQLPQHEREDTPPPLCIRDELTYYELAACKRRPNGDIRAAGRNKDDLAIALMIALVVNRDPEYGIPRPSMAQQRREMNALMVELGARGENAPYLERPLRA